MWTPQWRYWACFPGCCIPRQLSQSGRCPGSTRMNFGTRKPSWRMSLPLLRSWTRGLTAVTLSSPARSSSSEAPLYSRQGHSPRFEFYFLPPHSHFQKLSGSPANFYCSPPKPALVPQIRHLSLQPGPRIQNSYSNYIYYNISTNTWEAKAEETMTARKICIGPLCRSSTDKILL